MLQKLFNNKLRVLFFLILVTALVCVRIFEKQLFYDPFLAYFKQDFINLSLPIFDIIKLFLSLTFRFFLNSSISLLIIYIVFNDLEIIKFASIIYLLLFLILTISFYIVLNFYPESKMILFYIRRFMIQPILLMLFLAGFYFQKNKAMV